jgi:hypothetical protein
MADELEKIVERTLNVVKSKPEWITYVKTFKHPAGFLFCDDPLLHELSLAIDVENPVHSGASIASCLQKCKTLLNRD